jgi:hypothetical protein
MSQLRPKGERVGEIAAKAAVQLLFSTGKSFTVDGLREKLREFFRQEVRAELRAVAALSNVELITALLSCNRQLARVGQSNRSPCAARASSDLRTRCSACSYLLLPIPMM